MTKPQTIIGCALLVLALICQGLFAQAKKTTVEEVKSSPGTYVTDAVIVEGLVTQFVPATSTTTSYFLLQGFYGEVIKVNTAMTAPTTNRKYRVTGIVYVDPYTTEPFISEQSRIAMEESGPLTIFPATISVEKGEQTIATITGGIPPYSIEGSPDVSIATATVDGNSLIISGASRGQVTVTIKDAASPAGRTAATVQVTHTFIGIPIDLLIYIVAGLLLVLVATLVYFLTAKRKAPVYTPEPEGAKAVAAVAQQGPPPAEFSDFKTVKITASPPKTLRFIPGQLVMISGEDKGKSFKIAGYPTPEGSVVSLGTMPVDGDRAYAHILIDKKFRTVSRKQAELIYNNGKLFVRNFSDTNYTQVDGVELKVGEMAELKLNSIMRTGELEFQYKL